jgi:hypothetical protein
MAPATESTLTLARKSSILGMAVAWPVFMDGVKVGSIANGRVMEFKASAGRHRLNVKTIGMQSDSLELNLAGGETVGLACGIQPGMLVNTLFLRLESGPGSMGGAYSVHSTNLNQGKGFSATNVGKETPGWALPVAVISIVAGIIGLIVFGIPLGFVAMVCGSIATNVGENKGKIGIVLGIVDMLAAVCVMTMINN